MKLATYNIASGGFDSYSSSAPLPERLSLLQTAIQLINANIIGLTDTYRWKSVLQPADIQAHFNYPYSFHIDMDDTRVDKQIGVAILSRLPITAAAVRLHNRSAIKATVTTPSQRSIDIFVVYLDDISEATRAAQLQALTTFVSPQQPTIVMGDLNCIWPSHAQQTRQSMETFAQTRPAFRQRDDYAAIMQGFADLYQASALNTLLGAGFTQPKAELMPTAMTPLHTFGMPQPVVQVDHIIGRDVALTNFQTYSGTLFDTSSDHYPLSAELTFE